MEWHALHLVTEGLPSDFYIHTSLLNFNHHNYRKNSIILCKILTIIAALKERVRIMHVN